MELHAKYVYIKISQNNISFAFRIILGSGVELN